MDTALQKARLPQHGKVTISWGMKGGLLKWFCGFWVLVSISLSAPPGLAQGTVQFNNRITGVVDARVTFADGSGAVGAGYIATLWGAAEGQPLMPLSPTTVFRTSSAAALGYLVPVIVEVPGVLPGERASLQVRITGPNIDSFRCNASNTFSVVLGGGLLPPAALEGLQPISNLMCPEPSTVLFAITFGLACIFHRRVTGPVRSS